MALFRRGVEETHQRETGAPGVVPTLPQRGGYIWGEGATGCEKDPAVSVSVLGVSNRPGTGGPPVEQRIVARRGPAVELSYVKARLA